jgi:hypothetical protein
MLTKAELTFNDIVAVIALGVNPVQGADIHSECVRGRFHPPLHLRRHLSTPLASEKKESEFLKREKYVGSARLVTAFGILS